MHRSAVRPSPIFFALIALAVAGGVLATLFPALDLVRAEGEYFRLSDDRNVLGTLGIVLLVIGGWAVSLTLHEFGHAFVAYRGGDHSVADKGYLTLDIRHYTDPVLSIVLPVLLLLIGGIPLPGGAVWINRWALRSRRVASWVSLAGPLSNLGLGIALVAVATAVPMPDGLRIGLAYLALVQVLAFVLNILPVPGLDGYGAIEPYLSPPARELGAKARPWAPLVLFALIIGLPGIAAVFFDMSFFVYGLIGGDPSAAGAGFTAFLFWR